MDSSTSPDPLDTASRLGVLDLALPLVQKRLLLLLAPLVAGCAALGVTFLIDPTYTAATTFLPPQQQQSSAASALASLGALPGLGAIAGGIKSPADQYVSLMQSVSVTDRLIDSFKLIDVYDTKYRFQAREELARNVRISLGKKDGLITVEVDDKSPQRAAEMANRHVEELRRVTSELALTEAQQRRAFFEDQLKQTRASLAAAQLALQSSGFNTGALRAEPKAAAEGYARLKAEATAAEVRLQTLRRALADNTPEVQGQLTLLAALRAQLNRLESSVDAPSEADYVGKYREFKYQETLFELFSKQYELARLDESREGALIQVVDRAAAPEHKRKPKRALIAALTTFATFLLLCVWLLVRRAWQDSARDPVAAAKMARLSEAWRGR